MNNSTNVNMDKDNKKKRLLPLAVIVLGIFLFLVALFINHRMSVNVSEAKAIPKIEGQTELVLNEGYDETETSAYTVQGGTVSIVSDTTGGKAVWNEETSKLLIQAGLTSNASVTLEVSNGNAVENATITLYITITHNPCIKGPKECYLDGGYQASQSGVFAVYGKNVSVSITDESKTGLVTWNDEERKLDIAPGLKLGTYKIILTASNGNTELDSVWECVITVGKKCTVTGGWKYTSGTYKNNKLINPEDTVTVKIGDYVAELNPDTQTFEVLVPNGMYDITLSSKLFKSIELKDVHITHNHKLDTFYFEQPLLRPTEYFGYDLGGYDYTIWNDRTVSAISGVASEGFHATVTMAPYWNMYFRGNVGVKVNDKTFYILPRRDSQTQEVSIYVAEEIIAHNYNGTEKVRCVGSTGQNMKGVTVETDCTMKLTYLNGNYYVYLSVEGCEEESKLLVLNETTTGLDASYFTEGERTIELGSFSDMMVRYTDYSYELGNKAAEKAVGNIKLCNITGAYTYASGTYTEAGLRNAEDEVQIQIGNHVIVPDKNTQTYKAVVPAGTYDICLSSKQFRDVTVEGVKGKDTTKVGTAKFTVPKLTPTAYFGYNSGGYDYVLWVDRTVSAVGGAASEGFTATVTMKPDWNMYFRGNVGVKVNDKTFYILPRRDSETQEVSIYVAEEIIAHDYNGTEKVRLVGSTGQNMKGCTADTGCTMQVVYLNGNYYVYLSVEGCEEESKLLVLNETTTGLDAAYFAKGERTIELGSFSEMMVRYTDYSYELGNKAAEKVVGDVKLCNITGAYTYASGTYTEEGLRNAEDEVQIQIGNHVIVPDSETQTYKAVVPTGTYDICFSSKQFRDVTVEGVKGTDTTKVATANFAVPKLTPTAYFGYNSGGYDYVLWVDRTVSAVGGAASEGFTATVTMKPDWNMYFRGNVGVKVNDKTFYILPRRDSETQEVSIYVAEEIIAHDYNGTEKVRLVGSTGQNMKGCTADTGCTMQVVYLNGNYYVYLSVEGCEEESQLLVLNETTTGLDAAYFAEGERTIQLGSFSEMMVRYTDYSYELGNKAAEKAVGDIKLCNVTGAYTYASGTYTKEGLRNAADKVQIQIGNHVIVPDSETQTYKAVIPAGTYDICFSSKQFRDVTVEGVVGTDTTKVATATFMVPKLTPEANFGYNLSGFDYTLWNNSTVAAEDSTTGEGFTATVTMMPYSDSDFRGNVGVKVGDKTFYILPRRDSQTKEVFIYVAEEIIAHDYTGTEKVRCVGNTGQNMTNSNASTTCTMQVVYLNGNYYVYLSVDGCTEQSQLVVLNETTTGLDASYFADGDRTIRLGSFSKLMVRYRDYSYQLGNKAAENVVGDIKLCNITGAYTYASGTYTEAGLRNAADKVQIQIGNHVIVPDSETQTFKAVVPTGTYDVTLSSNYFRDVTVSSVEVNDATNVEATFTVPKMTSTAYTYNAIASEYGVWKTATPNPVGMSAEGGFTTTATMRPYENSRNRGNIGVSVNGNTFYIIPYRDPAEGEIYIYVSENMVGAWTYGTSVGGTGKILTDNAPTSKCTLKLTYLNGNYYVSVQIPGDNTTSPAIVLNPQSTGLDEKYFASGTRQVQFCGVTDMVEYYSDITYQIGDEAAKAALASVKEYAIPKLNIATKNTDVNTGIVANEGFVMSYSINADNYKSTDVWNPAGVYFAYSAEEKNFFALDRATGGLNHIVCKKWGNSNSYTAPPVTDYERGDTITIVYLKNKYYIILDNQIKVLDSTASFGANYGLGTNLFTTHPRTIGFMTSSATIAQFDNVTIRLGDSAAEDMLSNVGYVAKATKDVSSSENFLTTAVMTVRQFIEQLKKN